MPAMTTGPAGRHSTSANCAARSPHAASRRRSRSVGAGSWSGPTPDPKMGRGRANGATSSGADGCSSRGRADCLQMLCSGGRGEGDRVAEGLKLPDVGALAAFGIVAFDVEVGAQVDEVGVGVGQ